MQRCNKCKQPCHDMSQHQCIVDALGNSGAIAPKIPGHFNDKPQQTEPSLEQLTEIHIADLRRLAAEIDAELAEKITPGNNLGWNLGIEEARRIVASAFEKAQGE